MAETKRYYWLKLQNDFFESKEMKKLRKIAGGDTYTIIYLKMQLASIKNNGVLYYEGIEDNFADEVALDIDEDPENVRVTVSFLMKYGLLVEKPENEFSLPEAQKSIGSETSSAARVRKYRSNQKALQCNATVTDASRRVRVRDRDREEVEVDSKKNNGSEFSECVSFWQENMMRDMTPFEFQTMQSLIEDYSLEWMKESMKKAALLEPPKRNMKYIMGILKGWKQDGGVKPWEQEKKPIHSSQVVGEGRWIM